MVKLFGESNFCIAYSDDVTVHSISAEQHLDNLHVLHQLKQTTLTLKHCKCFFFKPEVLHLGHVLSSNGIKPQQNVKDVTRNMVQPTTTCFLKMSLGLKGYYRHFIPNFSAKAVPLNEFIKRGISVSEWGDCMGSFEHLRRALCSSSILICPNLILPYYLYTDFSEE